MLRQKLAENWQWSGLCLLLIVSSIYARPLIPIDETRYLSVAWEMWHSQNFLVPHINGHPYSDKPPLLFWFIHLSWLLFGVNEWSARVIGPLFGFGSIVLMRQLGKNLWPANRGVTLAAPFILLGTLIWGLYSTLTMFDTLLTFTALLALLCILAARRARSFAPWLGVSAAIGLGILAKGPIVLLYTLPPLLLAPCWSEKDHYLLEKVVWRFFSRASWRHCRCFMLGHSRRSCRRGRVSSGNSVQPDRWSDGQGFRPCSSVLLVHSAFAAALSPLVLLVTGMAWLEELFP